MPSWAIRGTRHIPLPVRAVVQRAAASNGTILPPVVAGVVDHPNSPPAYANARHAAEGCKNALIPPDLVCR